MTPYLPYSLVFIGLVILVAALAPLLRLVKMLPAGSVRNKWFSLCGLIFFFIAAYLGDIVVLWDQQTEWSQIPISGVFLFGAIFVWLTINLSLQTAIDLRRIDLLEAENISDPLTKVHNRRYLDSRLNEEFARSKRYSLGLSILMLDIDHFKQVNDTYGHQAGDIALSALAALVKSSLRELDVVARYGGEEFLVICTNTAIDGAVLVAERLRKTVESLQVIIPDGSTGNQVIHISVSIGVAEINESVESKQKLIQAADQALYRAKAEGRNRVIVAESEAGKPVKSRNPD